MPDDTGFSLILHYSPEMVAELALGADHPHEIAERYGLDATDYEHLAAQDWFQRLVVQKRHEFHETGVLFTAKAGMMAEALLTRLFQQSMANVLPPPLTVEVAKQLTEIGRLKPQPLNTTPGAAGGAFQINIQVNGSDVITSGPRTLPAPAPVGLNPPTPGSADKGGTTSMSLDATGVVLSPSLPEPKGTPPASISGLRVPDFDMRPASPLAAPGGAAAAFGGVGLPSLPRSA